MPSRVEASRAAIEHIQRRGGNLYIWVDGAGVEYVRTRPPRRRREWHRLEASGFTLFQDLQIPRPEFWRVALRRLKAYYNGTESGVSIPGGFGP